MKLLLKIGSAAITAMPIVGVVSCGVQVENGVAFLKSDNLIQFSLNTPKNKNKTNNFPPYAKGNEFSVKGLANLNKDVMRAMGKNNITKTKFGEKINVEFSYQYKIEKKDKDFIGGKMLATKTKILKFSVIYNKLQKNSILNKKPYGFKSNLILDILKGLKKAKFIDATQDISENWLVTMANDDTNVIKIIIPVTDKL